MKTECGFWIAESVMRLQCHRMLEDALTRTIRQATGGFFPIFSASTPHQMIQPWGMSDGE